MTPGLQWASQLTLSSLWRSTLPWYWTDDIAASLPEIDRVLVKELIDAEGGPVAIRRREATLDELLEGLGDGEDLPLAA